jgi:hypothetical protein
MRERVEETRTGAQLGQSEAMVFKLMPALLGCRLRLNSPLAVAHPNVRLDVGTEIRVLVNAKGRHTLRDDVVA